MENFAAIDRALEALLAEPSPQSAPDLFGFTTVKLGQTIYDDIWREASWSPWPVHNAELDAFVERIKALPLRSRVEQANVWINARVTYAADRSVISHHWGNLAQALSQGDGEREDIAIAKLQLLAAAGVPRANMYLVLVRDIRRVSDDALLVVRNDDQLYVLDSKQDGFLDAAQIGQYVPVLAFGAEGGWVFGKRWTGPGGAGATVAVLNSAQGYRTDQSLAARTQLSTATYGWLPPGGR